MEARDVGRGASGRLQASPACRKHSVGAQHSPGQGTSSREGAALIWAAASLEIPPKSGSLVPPSGSPQP